jgi:hypothetical protein
LTCRQTGTPARSPGNYALCRPNTRQNGWPTGSANTR